MRLVSRRRIKALPEPLLNEDLNENEKHDPIVGGLDWDQELIVSSQTQPCRALLGMGLLHKHHITRQLEV